MNKKGKMGALGIIAIVIIAFLVITQTSLLKNLGGNQGGIPSNQGQTGNQGTNICDLTQRATVTGRALDKLTAAKVDVNAEIWTKDNAPIQGETSLNGTTTLSSNLPMNFEGYIMTGNDNYVSSTDRGDDYYYTKRTVSYGCTGAVSEKDFNLAAEGTPTWTGYDDGTAESTLNVTVGSGETVTNVELKFAAAAKKYLGNPDFDRALAICFNTTSTDYPKWEYVRPINYDSTFSTPKFMASLFTVAGQCYVLPTGAVKDYGNYRFGVVLKANSGQNPGTGAVDLGAVLLDKTYFKDDTGAWVSGFGYDSAIGTSTDVGFDSVGNLMDIAIV